MRSSGASSESHLVVVVALVALAVVVLLMGGPSQFLTTLELALRGLLETAHQAWLRVAS